MFLVPLAAANAQGGLRDRISDLFIFGPGQSPLFLAGSGDPSNPISLQAHGLHFIPSSSAENASLITFITDALGVGAVIAALLVAIGAPRIWRLPLLFVFYVAALGIFQARDKT